MKKVYIAPLTEQPQLDPLMQRFLTNVVVSVKDQKFDGGVD